LYILKVVQAAQFVFKLVFKIFMIPGMNMLSTNHLFIRALVVDIIIIHNTVLLLIKSTLSIN